MNINEFTREGFLKKRGGSYKSWKKRWCSLHENKLFYYEKQEHSNMKNHIPKGFIYLEDCSISVKSLEKNQFEICVRDKKRKYLVEANSNDEMMEWILGIFIHRDQYYFAQIGAMNSNQDEDYRRNSYNLPQIFNIEQFVTFEVQKIEKTKKKPFRCFVINKEDGTIGIGKGNMKKRSKTVTKAITKSGNTFGSLQDAFQFYQKFNPENLIRFERAVSDKTKIRLMWDVKGHFNDYIFTSGVSRERFINEITQIKVQCLGKKELALLYEPIKIKLFIGTWNIGSAAPPDDLSDWIPNNQDIDIFAIATQECDYSPRQGYSNTQDDWTVTLSMHLGTKYTLIAKQSLMGIKLHVFIKEIYIKHVHCIQTETKATGVAGVVGNKGACGVAFQLHDSSFCFVGSHLAAREERIAIRAENYRDIIGGLHFGIPGVDITEQFQYLFWFGDLNYRCEYPFDVGVELGMKKDYQKLLEKDQLKREMSQGKVFQGFSEGKIDFPPSYRYTRGEVNIFSDQKRRAPSYCDRILWRCLPNFDVEQLSYQPHLSFTTSDHKPVSSTFTLEIPPLLTHDSIDKNAFCVINFSVLFGKNFRTLKSCLDEKEKEKQKSIRIDSQITFEAPFLDSDSTTELVLNNPNPIFNKIPALFPFITSKNYLENHHIILIVKDKRGQIIGQAPVSLKGSCDKNPIQFLAIIRKKGFLLGEISGSVHITWPSLNLIRF